ncbi:DUF4381 domain-containing protein [Vibrio coralliilyticus]|uniref:DUF4381 domain-containing protein n=1 Tax=Vibrio coralliilyticus TaxID=190893 RepID=UPI0003665D56|nr:DUF4381 domain-containing protein [Vibrio coralliilyticus]
MSTNNKDSLLPLNPMHLPEVPSWFPLAWGWWATAGAIVFGTLIVWLTYRWNKKRMAPKKTALKLIQAGDKPAEAIELLRQAALCYYPREEVAQLTGKEWYAFLDTQVKSPVCLENYELWQEALYSKEPVGNASELITHCSQWVDEALPPKRRRAKVG